MDALIYTRRNAEGTGVEVVQADVTSPDLLTELNGAVDLIVANPPYIPQDTELEPEVARHDPPQAHRRGRARDHRADRDRRRKAPGAGGAIGIEHDDSNGGRTRELLTASDLFDEVVQRHDLAGRPRFVTARRKIAAS